jgi:perosamine synthetase
VSKKKKNNLAIHGGAPFRRTPMPYRALFGEEELKAVARVFNDSWEDEQDFGYQGKYEEEYTSAFCSFQGGGYADAVCSGTVAVYLAVLALNLEAGSQVILSPVTDPGCVSAVILAGFKPVLADSAPNQFNVGPDQFEAAITPDARAAVLTHTGGTPIEMDRIVEIADIYNIKIVEDCSQAHGARYKGKRVGCFGDIAAFSTMFSKNHSTGGCGGIVYTTHEHHYWAVRSLADRGKPFYKRGFDLKDPSEFLYPALNFNLNELSCAIGVSTLTRLPEIIEKRYKIAREIDTALQSSEVVFPCSFPPQSEPSVFFHTAQVDADRIKVPKSEFAKAVAAEGIWINPDYRYVVSEWKWMKNYNYIGETTPNATNFRDKTFNILFNERFSSLDIQDILNSILKVEEYYAK